MEWEWDYLLAARSSKIIKAVCGPLRMMDQERRSHFRFRL
jgi:hypothetical protein